MNNRGRSSRGRGQRRGPRRDAGPSIMNNGIQRPLKHKEMVFTAVHSDYTTDIDISQPPDYGAVFIAISQFPAATNLLAAFDQYRVLEVSITFVPHVVTNFILAASAATFVPTIVYNHNTLVTNVDQDDAVVPGSENAVLNHESAVFHGPFIRSFTRTFKPMIAAEVYQTGGFGGYAPQQDKWLDSAYPNVQHYGLKYAVAHGSFCANAALVYMSIYTQVKVQYRKAL